MDTTSSSRPDRGTANTWKLVVAYDGTDFHGWQVQPGLRTIQGELARALFEITGERVLPQGSGRTDTGVHAEGQVVSVELQTPIPADRLHLALNRRLPSAIRVFSVEAMPSGFHARSEVSGKTYEYRIFSRRDAVTGKERICAPWRSRFSWDCRWPLSLEWLQAAAFKVEGTHDFSSFAAHDPDRSARIASLNEQDGPMACSNVRTVFRSEWKREGELLLYRVTGSGFLHHMVRNLVGTFVEIGAGRRAVDSLPGLLAARDRRLAGPTVPPQGLFLMHVDYRQRDLEHSAEFSAAALSCVSADHLPVTVPKVVPV